MPSCPICRSFVCGAAPLEKPVVGERTVARPSADDARDERLKANIRRITSRDLPAEPTDDVQSPLDQVTR